MPIRCLSCSCLRLFSNIHYFTKHFLLSYYESYSRFCQYERETPQSASKMVAVAVFPFSFTVVNVFNMYSHMPLLAKVAQRVLKSKYYWFTRNYATAMERRTWKWNVSESLGCNPVRFRSGDSKSQPKTIGFSNRVKLTESPGMYDVPQNRSGHHTAIY